MIKKKAFSVLKSPWLHKLLGLRMTSQGYVEEWFAEEWMWTRVADYWCDKSKKIF